MKSFFLFFILWKRKLVILGSVLIVRHVHESFCKAWVRIHTVTQLAQTNLVNDGLSYLRNHVATWTTNEGCSDYLVCSFSAVDLVDASSGLAGGPVKSVEPLGVCFELNVLLLQGNLVQTHSCDFWVCVGVEWKHNIILVVLLA